MSLVYQRTEGFILRLIPFRDYDQIIVLFTRDAGLIKVLYKGCRSKRRGVQGMCVPLTKVEVVYREKRGEIFSCQELALIESYQELRLEFNRLEAACDLLHTIYSTQLVGKPSHQLYDLLDIYLQKISSIGDPKALSLSFRLKLLKHEGIAAYPFFCSECQEPLMQHVYWHEADFWCAEHRMKGSQYWTKEQAHLLYSLGNCQYYRELESCEISPELYQTTIEYFDACIRK